MRPTIRVYASTLLCASVLSVAAHRAAPARTDRLEALARLDAAVHYFHPAVATGAIEWDSLLAARVVAIADAPTQAEYAQRVSDLLARLGDGATRLVHPNRVWGFSLTADSVLVIAPSARPASARDLANAAERASVVVVDLRGDADAPPDAMLAMLVRGTIDAPAQRTLEYSGFPSPAGTGAQMYRIHWRATEGEHFQGASTAARRVAFLADGASVFPPVALALRENGAAVLVGAGAQRVALAGRTYRVSLGENVLADVRVGERTTAVAGTDTVLAASGDAVATAARYARSAAPATLSRAAAIDTVTSVRPLVPPSYPAWIGTYPAVGYRLIATFRLWSTMHYFYPYKHLFADDWNAALRNAIPSVENAVDSVAFATSIAAQATHIHDSHVSANARVLYSNVIGTIPTALRVRFIEDKLVITGIVSDSVRTRTGLRIGDVITTIDGQPVQARVALLSRYLVSSTPQALRNRLASSMLTGAQGSVARLIVRDSTGADRPVELRRSDMYYPLVIAKDRAGTSLFRILPGNIGYVDLDRLPVESVDSMFNAMRDTKAIIFDDRGYPLGTAWAIAPRLNANPEPTPAASFRRLIVPSPDTADTYLLKFTQPIPPRGTASRYTGQTVMLINERTISQAEHTGLFFLAANGTKFIGSPTMGANGDVTSVVLPGRIAVSFTGHDVRFPNDKQLQRVGVQPDIPVTPTIAGVRMGRDEVLIAALKYLGASGEIPPDSGTDVLRPRVALTPEPMFDGWAVTSGTNSYRIGIDRSVMHGGTGAGHVTATEGNPSSAAILMQAIRADDFRGKRVRFSAYLRTQGATGSGAGLWLRVDANGGSAALDNMSTRRVTRNTEWTRVECVLDVVDDAVGLAMGLLYGGPGEVWIDDVSLEIVGTDVPVTATDFQPRTNPANAAAQRDMYAKYPARPANLDFERIR